MRAARWIISGIIVSAPFISLHAQTPHYKMELSEGTSGYVILENDSQSSIEAFHVQGDCILPEKSLPTSGMEAAVDILDFPNGYFLSGGGDRTLHKGGIQPWERMSFTNVNATPQPHPCTWNVRTDAIIYADGTYEGDDVKVKALQAKRDGIAASLNYWSSKLSTPPTNPSDFELIETLAKTQSEQDFENQKGRCFSSRVVCAYWQGRWQVDKNVAGIIKQTKERPELHKRSVVDFINRWQKEVANSVSFKKLDAIFPLSPDLQALQPKTPKVD